MAKFIKISTEQDELLLVNTSHIQYVAKGQNDRGAILFLSIEINGVKEIKSQQNLKEIEDLLKN